MDNNFYKYKKYKNKYLYHKIGGMNNNSVSDILTGILGALQKYLKLPLDTPDKSDDNIKSTFNTINTIFTVNKSNTEFTTIGLHYLICKIIICNYINTLYILYIPIPSHCTIS